jgi:hypothetical protein
MCCKTVADENADCLTSLDEPDARVRIHQVAKRHKDSFEWLFSDQVPFVGWLLDSGHHFSHLFWMTGKPGSGKSTAMKFAMQDSRLAKILPNTNIIAYFFHLHGKHVAQKSFKDMLTEILYQLLEDKPRLFSSVGALCRSLVQTQRTGTPDWDTNSLQSAVFSALLPPSADTVTPKIFFSLTLWTRMRTNPGTEICSISSKV